MGVAVVDGHRPVLCDRYVRRNIQTIVSIALERLLILVVGCQQIVLGLSQMLGAEEGECIDGTSGVDRKGIRHLPETHDILVHFFSDREKPPFAFIVRREFVVSSIEPDLRLLDCVVKDLLGFRVRIERFAPLDADGLELVDHHLISFQPRLGLHHLIERLEEAQVVSDSAVEQDTARIDEFRWRLVGGLRERIEFDALGVSDCIRDVSIAAALQNGTQQGVALIGVRRNGNISIGHVGLVIAGWHEEIFATFALVHAARPHILDGGLPVIHDTAVEQAIIGGRDL
jgi:hypothetical protein